MSLLVLGARFQDENADLDYVINYSRDGWLTDGDTIVSSSWEVVGGDGELELHDEGFNTTSAQVWVRGGTVGQTYVVANTITTQHTPARTTRLAFNLTIKG